MTGLGFGLGFGLDFSLTVLIPTYRPGEDLKLLLERLALQKKLPDRVLIINTEEKYFPGDIIDAYKDRFKSFSVFHIGREEFDHGGTRHLGMQFCSTDLVLNMTQDAIPKNPYLTERLCRAFDDPKVAAAYARQLAKPGADDLEYYSRKFNYPAVSRIKSEDDLGRLGLKTFFCSDVCAVWRRDVYFALGGFEKKVIFNEDMIFASKLIRQGYKIAYCADAQVWHSHHYGPVRQFHRNFDLAVSQADHPEVFAAYPSEGEGLRLVKGTAGYLLKKGNPAGIFSLFLLSAGKYAGYFLGKRYKKLPPGLIRVLTDNPAYWEGIRRVKQ